MNKPWKTLIIDDEVLARKRLVRLLKTYEEIEIIGEAVNGQDGLEKIEELKPELIFLDIEMPVFNGCCCIRRLLIKAPYRTPSKRWYAWQYSHKQEGRT